MKLWNGLSAGLFLGLFVVILTTFKDYGITWDEIFHYGYGEAKLAYYEQLFSSDDPWAVVQSAPADNYPGFYDLLLAMARRISPLSKAYTNHLLCALFGLFGIGAVWAIGHRLGGARTAFICALFLTFMPRYYGHMWFNLKDIPFATMFAWSLYCLIRFTECLPKVSWRWLIVSGIVTGCAIGVRSAGLLLPCYFFVVLFGDWLRSVCRGGEKKAMLRLAIRHAGVLALYGFVALISVLPWWPYLHANPLWRPIEITMGLQNFFWDGLVLFNGEYLRPGTLPRSYLPVWFAITTPVVILLMLAVGCVPLVKICWVQAKGRLKDLGNRELILGLLVLAFAFPLLYVALTKPKIYDGLRQFLFILPPAAILAALSLEWLLAQIAKPGLRKALLVGSLGVTAAGSTLSYLSLHPYEYIYFNETIGGLPGAFMRFETEYYGLSYREMMEELIANGERVPWDRPTRVSNNGAQWHIEPFMTSDYKYVPYTEPSDYFLTYTRKNVVPPQGEIVGFVEREGVPLNYAIRRWTPGQPDPLGAPLREPAATDSPPAPAP